MDINNDYATRMQPMERKSLTTYVMESVRELIIENGLQPDDALPPEGALAEQLGVSRTSVREAVRKLAALGVVEVRHGQGIFVKGFDFDALIDSLSYSLSVEGRHICELLEVREGLEVVFAPSVVSNATQEDIEDLENIIALMRAKAARGEIFPEEDQQFHLSLYHCTKNDLLLKLIRIFWIAFRQLRAVWFERGWEVDAVITAEDHAAILEALKLGDVDLLSQRIVAHYAPLRRQLVEKGLGAVGSDVAPEAAANKDPYEHA